MVGITYNNGRLERHMWKDKVISVTWLRVLQSRWQMSGSEMMH